MQITATAMLPSDDTDRARFALRLRLLEIIERKQIPSESLDGATMLMAGPTTLTDAAGHTWYEWVATLRTRPPVLPRRHLSDDRAVRPTVADLGLLRRHAG